MTDETLTPTPEEHAYHLGWKTYFAGQSVATNPYSMDDEIALYEQFDNGWSSAQRGDLNNEAF